MSLDRYMRKLQFTAHSELNRVESSADTQTQVAELLANKLERYGFQTLSQSGDQIAVSVDQHELPLSVTCQGQDESGRLVCEITSYPDEDQDWLDRITEQSLLNQLAQAVENSLKEEESYSEFQWKQMTK